MIYSHNSTGALLLGIDGGGSKCKAKLVSSDDQLQGVGIAGRANPVHGLERTIESILESSYLALDDAGLDRKNISDIHAGIGLAGVNLPSIYKSVADWKHPFRSMHLTTDFYIACLGAHQGSDGGVIITGTGSCGISIINDQATVYGSHGFPIGDQCSGAWIGLKGITAALLDHDKLGPATALTDAINQELKIESGSLAELMLNQPPKTFAKLAPLVFRTARAGDAEAIEIIRSGAEYVNNIALKILDSNQQRLSLIGGLRTEIFEWLTPEVQQQLVEPISEPEEGALLFVETQINPPKSEAC